MNWISEHGQLSNLLKALISLFYAIQEIPTVFSLESNGTYSANNNIIIFLFWGHHNSICTGGIHLGLSTFQKMGEYYISFDIIHIYRVHLCEHYWEDEPHIIHDENILKLYI